MCSILRDFAPSPCRAKCIGSMSTYLPTIRQLQYLVALHEHGHFGRAAESCFVSQSTLSAGIRELESLLGVTLVERSRRVVRFTALGEQVVEKAHRLLREAEELSDLVQAAGKPLSGTLRMSVIPTIAPFMLPRILPRLKRERPELKLMLREETSHDAVESLQHGRVDCVLLALPFATAGIDPCLDDRRRQAAAAGRRALPEGTCAGRLQPARTARLCHHDRHFAAHAGADGGQ